MPQVMRNTRYPAQPAACRHLPLLAPATAGDAHMRDTELACYGGSKQLTQLCSRSECMYLLHLKWGTLRCFDERLVGAS